MSGFLETLEQSVADRLTSQPYFADVDVHVDPQQDIEKLFNDHIARTGLTVIPFVGEASDSSSGLDGPYFDEINVVVTVVHNPVLGAALKSPREVAEQVHAALKGWNPDNCSNTLVPSKPAIAYSPGKGPNEEGLNLYTCRFIVRGGFTQTMTAVAMPVITQQGHDTALIACATAGAAIFYTLDGKLPMPLTISGPGLLYTAGGVTVSPSQTIKARAFLAGYLHSPTVTQLIS